MDNKNANRRKTRGGSGRSRGRRNKQWSNNSPQFHFKSLVSDGRVTNQHDFTSFLFKKTYLNFPSNFRQRFQNESNLTFYNLMKRQEKKIVALMEISRFVEKLERSENS